MLSAKLPWLLYASHESDKHFEELIWDSEGNETLDEWLQRNKNGTEAMEAVHNSNNLFHRLSRWTRVISTFDEIDGILMNDIGID